MLGKFLTMNKAGKGSVSLMEERAEAELTGHCGEPVIYRLASVVEV